MDDYKIKPPLAAERDYNMLILIWEGFFPVIKFIHGSLDLSYLESDRFPRLSSDACR
jgi:hypothetical protein